MTHNLPRKIRKMLAAKDRGKAAYVEADELLEEILAELQPGQQVKLGGGEWAEVVDNFAEKNKVFKPAGVARFEVKVTRS